MSPNILSSSFIQAASSKQLRFARCYPLLLSILSTISFLCSVSAEQPFVVKERPIADAFDLPIQRVLYTPGALSIPVEWVYTNHWGIPLVIERVDTDCGCLAPHVEHKQIAPGAKGVLRATVTPGTLRGALHKSLTVRFVAYAEPVQIMVETNIPAAVELSCRELVWPVKSSATSGDAQIINVTSGNKADFAITGLLGVQASQFVISQKTIVHGQHYQILVTPTNPTADVSAAMQIRTNSPDPRDQVLVVPLRQTPSVP